MQAFGKEVNMVPKEIQISIFEWKDSGLSMNEVAQRISERYGVTYDPRTVDKYYTASPLTVPW